MMMFVGNGCHEREPRLAKRVSLSDPLPYPNEVHEEGAWEGKQRRLGFLVHRAERYVNASNAVIRQELNLLWKPSVYQSWTKSGSWKVYGRTV